MSADVHTVGCLACGASPGSPCHFPGMGPSTIEQRMASCHVQRMRLADAYELSQNARALAGHDARIVTLCDAIDRLCGIGGRFA